MKLFSWFDNFPFCLFLIGLLIIPVTSIYPPGMNYVYLSQNKNLLSMIETTIMSQLLRSNYCFAFIQVLVMDTPT